MEKIFEGAISCKALLEAGSRDCKKLYIDKKKNRRSHKCDDKENCVYLHYYDDESI